MGIVEAVGNEVKNIRVGDFVIAPFVISGGTCPECKAGETALAPTACSSERTDTTLVKAKK